MKQEIKFGTDGWRGLIAKDFTFENINLVSLATADQFLEDLSTNKSLKNLVFVGYDRRFLGKEFAECTSRIFSLKGLNVNLYSQDVPTPMVSFDVKKNNAVGGIVITASHNPPEFSGFKIKQSYGCSAKKEYTDKIEKRLKNIDMHAHLYGQGDYLLFHDDVVEKRKIAYILYLSKGFSVKDGGRLELYNVENPLKPQKSIIPDFNSFLCFKVSRKSLHAVEEIKTRKQRVTIGGWFYGN